MKVKEIIALLKAGYTKEEIAEFKALEAKKEKNRKKIRKMIRKKIRKKIRSRLQGSRNWLHR